MIRNNKKLLIFTSLLTLLPIAMGLLLWDRLPEVMTTHWGFSGQADGRSSAAFAVFVPPVLMLAVHWFCVLFTARDPGNRDRNKKMQQLVLWIVPLISNLSSGSIYALALGAEFSVTNVMVAFLGILFAVMGNYMPKCRMNSTIGIKVPWAYTSQENWNATHRFGGKVWVAGSIIILLCALIPGEWTLLVMLVLLAVLCIVPVVYSWRFYKKEKAAGKALLPMYPQVSARARTISIIAVALILAGTAYLMFSGSIAVSYQEDYFTVKGSYYGGSTIFYDVIDSVEYRDGNVSGVRTMGWGSARLLLGTFENEEFGYYTRYTYTRPEACVVVTAGEQTLVLSGRNTEETKAIYENLLVLTEKE